MEPIDLNLRDIVFEADSKIPIAMLLYAQSTYVVRNIYAMAKQMHRDEPKNALDPNHNPNRIQMLPVETLKVRRRNIYVFSNFYLKKKTIFRHLTGGFPYLMTNGW